MPLTQDDILTIKGIMEELLNPMNVKIEQMRTNIEAMQTNIEAIQTNIEAMTTNIEKTTVAVENIDVRVKRLRTQGRINEIMMRNSLMGVHDTLIPIPNQNGIVPMIEHPTNISQLSQGGSEQMAGGGSSWSTEKSLAFIMEYDEGYETENRGTFESSRRRRHRVASILGVTKAQINFCHFSF